MRETPPMSEVVETWLDAFHAEWLEGYDPDRYTDYEEWELEERDYVPTPKTPEPVYGHGGFKKILC
jgi:hypothetical protein